MVGRSVSCDVQSRKRGTVIADSQANLKAAIKMRNAQGSIRAVFESLDLGWSYEDVEDYLFGLLGDDKHGFFQGVMGFACVVAERIREIEPGAFASVLNRRIEIYEDVLETIASEFVWPAADIARAGLQEAKHAL